MKRLLIASLGLNLLVLGYARAEKLDYLKLKDLKQVLAEVSTGTADDQPTCTFWRGAAVDQDVEGVADETAVVGDDGVASTDEGEGTGKREKHEPESEGDSPALLWFQNFAADQSLFSDLHLLAMHEGISSMSPGDQRQWMEDTALVRSALDSAQWQETSKWLSEFWRVQAFYSEQEESTFKERMTKLTSEEILIVMEHLASHRQARLRRRQMEDIGRSSFQGPILRSMPGATSLLPAVFPSPNIPHRHARRVVRQDRLSERIRNWYIFRGVFWY